MSARDILREVMSAQHDLVEDPDTDAVSVTSTDAGSAEAFYTADCIIAEDPEADNCYLVSWEGYPLDQCTWEPPAHLDDTQLIANWGEIRKELGEAAFQRENEKNIAAYEDAQARADAAKERRLEKRERKRQRLRRQNRPTVVFDNDSSEEEPLASVRRRAAEAGSLFVKDSGPSVASPSHTRHAPVARKAPLQQSSSEEESDSEARMSDHSPMAELRKNPKAQRKADRSAAGNPMGISMLKPNLNQKTEALSKSKANSSSNAPNREDEALEKVRTSKSSVHASTAQRITVSAVSKKSTAQPKLTAGSSGAKDGSTALPPTTTKPMRAIRTAPSKQPRAINIIDQPMERQRKEWSTDHHYNKLKYRGIADKRSRTEGVPDFNALDFVNGPPPTLPKSAPAVSRGDPYGRREVANRRVQEEDDPDDRPRQGAPLADWEADKVPQMCASWRLSSNCPYDAKKCLFMHREFDPQGKPYQLGDLHGRVPHKYRKPPITCPFWFRGRRCNKTAEQCLYAHKDTGWAEINGKPIQIALLPPDLAEPTPQDLPPHLTPFKLQDPPITCSFWLRDPHGCTKTQEECKFAHWNTGWAPPETNIIKGHPVKIDPNLKPRGGPPKHADPPITCPFWLRGVTGCTKTDDECRYAHWNTGWAPPALSNDTALPISLQELPRYRPVESVPDAVNTMPSRTMSNDQNLAPAVQTPPADPEIQSSKKITCTSWLRNAHGCPKSEDACNFAHRNTGWATPKDRPYDPPVKLDPNQIPRFHREQKRGRLEPKYENPPITCPAWLRNEDGCPKSEEDCRFAHKNTGWIRQYVERGGPPVTIDRKETPRYIEPVPNFVPIRPEPKSTYPTTCYFWLEGMRGCHKSADACKFAHWNTGWMVHVGVDSRPKQIDPSKTPRFRKYDPTEASSLSNSHSTQPTATMSSRSATELEDYTDAVVAPEQQLVHSPLTMQAALPEQLLTATQCSQLNQKIAQIYNLNIAEMFRSNISSDDNMLERRAMLLYHPEEHSEDLELIMRWLLMHNVEVGSLWYDGAWRHFQEETCPSLEQTASGQTERSGIIIVHPDFEQYVDLPGFGEVLKKRIRVWSVGLQPPFDFEPGVSPADPVLRHDRIEVFPHGGFIYITDDVFEQKPQLALAIVKLFFAKIEQLRGLDGPASYWQEVDDACLLWRLCVRPELMESLYQKCEDNAAELAARNPDYLSRAELYQLLTFTNYIEQDHPIEPLSLVEDKYPILSERRIFAEGQPLDYFNRLANSQEDANTHVMGYYAAMQTSLRRDYRHFYVVHTEPDAKCAQEWKAKVHNIAEIITPERCMEELEKDSKESLFDFLDWAMGPKEPKEDDLGDALVETETVEHAAHHDSGLAPMEIQAVQHTAY